MRAIDDETDAKNAIVDQSKEQQFRENDTAQSNRQQIIDETTVGVQRTLDQMREEAKAAREAGRPTAEDRSKERDDQIATAQAEFDAAVELANNATAPSDAETKPDDAAPPQPPVAPPKMPEPGTVDLPKVDLPGIDDPELQPPNAKDLRLDLNPDAQAAMDQFANGPETDRTEVAGNFDARGLGLGSGATTIPQQAPEPLKKLEPIAAEDDPVEVIFAPQLRLDPEQADDMNVDGEQDNEVAADNQVNVPLDLTEPIDQSDPTDPESSPTLDVAAITEAFASVGRSLAAFDSAIADSTSQLQLPAMTGGEFSEDMKRAIIQTAENTRRLVERSQSGGLVFS
ncbi:hypothetical protein [Rhodopirellula sp. SWK7]|uniref:hypothetical protein n=1 Tax=Rhodopirellula sp. SWK7 TaxID=595460 RepID=UPI0002BF4D18|nr:hypothetical protein [Rhodopirellula sp. SWK7]EMI44159.1 hypothetical protein RRSWK_03354 [Rhodopirellula sp. SWK7]